MNKKVHYRYNVEGENEKSLLEVLKRDLQCIEAGKIEIFNAVKDKLTPMRIRTFKSNKVVVLVYDTDVEKVDILKENIKFLQKQKCIKDIICIPQVNNLEDELKRSCDVKNVLEITRSTSQKEFKSDFNKCTNLSNRLLECHFNIDLMWKITPSNTFKQFENQSNKIKL